ncbi:MAG TPA: 30S ribosomal protein S17 [Candidatus Doudnabacteria bacterium]|nr:30S ribosomal protein S17 [Candidatus Doudnabacteria bacterium]
MTTQSKQQLTGIVVSNKMDKTVVVKVDLVKRHPKYHKSYTKSYRYKAHDADNSCSIGDKVVIESSRPISKDKRFTVLKKV